jgi:hypothetical protein
MKVWVQPAEVAASAEESEGRAAQRLGVVWTASRGSLHAMSISQRRVVPIEGVFAAGNRADAGLVSLPMRVQVDATQTRDGRASKAKQTVAMRCGRMQSVWRVQGGFSSSFSLVTAEGRV